MRRWKGRAQGAMNGSMTSLATPRLLLRPWRETDLEPFAALNSDPRVARYLGQPLSAAQSDALAERLRSDLAFRGFGLWAVELPGKVGFIGFIGLSVPRFEAHFTPCVELGWRLAADFHGRGYATEGAGAAVRHAFDVLGLTELVSFTVPKNVASRRVMEKLGMRRDPTDDFDHPLLPAGHPLRRHVLYRLRPAWP